MTVKDTLQQERAGFNNDRCTTVIKVHYQEFEPNNVTVASHAYDWTNDQAAIPWQTTQRVGPSSRVPLNLGHLEGQSCMLVLSHDFPKLPPDVAKALQEAMRKNTIRLTNADGLEVAILRPRRACLIEFSFPVFAQSTDATALLSITAIPVNNAEVSTE